MGPKKSHASAGHMIQLVCPHCSKEFNGNSSTSGVRSNYRRHLLTHTGERPYPCPYCHSSFTTKPNLRRHISTFHALHLTPQNRPQEATENVEPALPMPPLVLPGATTAPPSSAAGVGSAKHEDPGSVVATSESNGLTSSPASQTVSEFISEGLEQRQQLPTTFVCQDCELEVSSQAKLRRHQRYYCPFRDNIFVDPVQDALNRFRAEQQLQQENSEVDDDADEASDDDDDHCVDSDEKLVLKGHGSRSSNLALRQSSRRSGGHNSSSLILTEEERMYLTCVAAQSGLKFVEDAYASDDGSDMSESDSRGTYISGSSSVTGDAVDTAKHAVSQLPLQLSLEETDSSDGAGTSPSSKSRLCTSVDRRRPAHTPLHGALLSPGGRTPRIPPRWVTGEGETSSANALMGTVDHPVVDDVDPGEDLLHVHYHRRGSGHKRERRILQKRLRAQEGVLLGLTTSPLRRPQKRPRADPTRAATVDTRTGKETTTTASLLGPSPPLGAASIVVSEQLVSRADSLLTLSRRPSHHSTVGVSSEFVCAYCNDFNVFSNQRQLTQHMRRVHPAEAARNAARATGQDSASADDASPPPPL
jgi:DNA-directed RNA polymerase subunit RPC12/RpoP